MLSDLLGMRLIQAALDESEREVVALREESARLRAIVAAGVDAHALCSLILDGLRLDTRDVYFTQEHAQSQHVYAWALVERLAKKRAEHVGVAGGEHG